LRMSRTMQERGRFKGPTHQARDFGLVRIADDEVNACELRDFFRGALRVATRDDNARAGIGAVNLVHRFASLGIGGSRDGAGIQDDHVRTFVLFNERESVRAQIAAQRRSVGACGAAPEIFNRKGGHVMGGTVLQAI